MSEAQTVRRRRPRPFLGLSVSAQWGLAAARTNGSVLIENDQPFRPNGRFTGRSSEAAGELSPQRESDVLTVWLDRIHGPDSPAYLEITRSKRPPAQVDDLYLVVPRAALGGASEAITLTSDCFSRDHYNPGFQNAVLATLAAEEQNRPRTAPRIFGGKSHRKDSLRPHLTGFSGIRRLGECPKKVPRHRCCSAVCFSLLSAVQSRLVVLCYTTLWCVCMLVFMYTIHYRRKLLGQNSVGSAPDRDGPLWLSHGRSSGSPGNGIST
jgi:hypothetical protein